MVTFLTIFVFSSSVLPKPEWCVFGVNIDGLLKAEHWVSVSQYCGQLCFSSIDCFSLQKEAFLTGLGTGQVYSHQEMGNRYSLTIFWYGSFCLTDWAFKIHQEMVVPLGSPFNQRRMKKQTLPVSFSLLPPQLPCLILKTIRFFIVPRTDLARKKPEVSGRHADAGAHL